MKYTFIHELLYLFVGHLRISFVPLAYLSRLCLNKSLRINNKCSPGGSAQPVSKNMYHDTIKTAMYIFCVEARVHGTIILTVSEITISKFPQHAAACFVSIETKLHCSEIIGLRGNNSVFPYFLKLEYR